MSVAVRAWLSLALVLAGVYGSYSFWRAYQAHAADAEDNAAESAPLKNEAGEAVAKLTKSTPLPPVPLEEFTFTDENGEPFEMKSLEGKIWAASYFFATCPGFCLQMNYGIAGIAEDLEDEDVTFISFTVDPETDTPEDLKAYAEKLGADPKRWKFLTGSADEIKKLGQEWLKMPATKEHNDKLVLVGADGRVEGWYSTRETIKVRRFKRKVLEMLDSGEQDEAAETADQSAAEGDAS